MLKTTSGSSLSASSAIASCISASPWPHDPVAARAPAAAAPSAMFTASISLSALRQWPPASGIRRDMLSSSPVNGDIGYPAKNRQPAAIADSVMAAQPSRS